MKNLLYDGMEPCVKMEQVPIQDAMGGYDSTGWADTLAFIAYVRKETAPVITVAEKEGAKETFTVVVPSNVKLKDHDVFRRVKDGAVFRLTSNTMDGETLSASSVPIAKANCERWVLT